VSISIRLAGMSGIWDSQILQALTCFSFPSSVDLFSFREMSGFLPNSTKSASTLHRSHDGIESKRRVRLFLREAIFRGGAESSSRILRASKHNTAASQAFCFANGPPAFSRTGCKTPNQRRIHGRRCAHIAPVLADIVQVDEHARDAICRDSRTAENQGSRMSRA
jgi:hypothetical protein